MNPQEILAQISATFKTIVQQRHLHPTKLEIELNEYDNVEIYKDIIQELDLHPTLFDIELTLAETLHVYLIAPEFSGKTDRERDLMIWPALDKKLPYGVLMDISVCMLLAPEEKAKMEELRSV